MAEITKKEFERNMAIIPFIIGIVGLIIVVILAIWGLYLILQL